MPEHSLPTGDFTPQQLKIVETGIPDVKVAVAVSATSGLEVDVIDLRTQRGEAPARPLPSTDRRVIETTSFLDELARRPLTDCGTLWGSATLGKAIAVYDDHPVSATGYGRGEDELVLQLTTDPDWKRWHEVSGKWYSQEDFGLLVEELLHTVISPDQAELLEVIDSIRTSTNAQFSSDIDRNRDGQKLTYNKEVNATAGRSKELEVPRKIKLRLRPWEGHANTYEVDAHFQLKVPGGSLALAIKLAPTQQIIRTAWNEVVATIAGATGKPVLAF